MTALKSNEYKTEKLKLKNQFYWFCVLEIVKIVHDLTSARIRWHSILIAIRIIYPIGIEFTVI